MWIEKEAKRQSRSGRSTKTLSTDKQRHRILGAAMVKFSYTGYLGTTITAIAAEAGVSHGLVHHYFGSKEQLFNALVKSGLDFLQQVRKAAFSGGNTPEERLRRWIFSFTHGLGQTNVYDLYSRFVMQILGAPGIHPEESTDALNRFTETEIKALRAVLSEMESQSEQRSCLIFNMLLGSQMISTGLPNNKDHLYEAGCRLLNIDSEPVPDRLPLPPLPWIALNEENLHCEKE